MKSFISLAVILFMGVCAPVQALVPQPSTDGSQAILFNEKELSYFAGAVVASGTKDLFVGTGPWTAFIPTNEAIEKFGIKKWQELLKPENQDRLMDIITYHVIPGKYLSRTMRSETIITVEGKPITIQVDNDVIRVNKAKIIKADLVGPNGVVHEIDTLLIP